MYRNISENTTLRALSTDVNRVINNTSTTALTHVEDQANILAKYDDFMKDDRLNSFKVEDYYFLKKNLSSQPAPEE